MARILVTESIAERGLDQLRKAGHQVDVREGLTPAELKQRILDLNARVKTKYNAKYGDLDTNMTAELADIDESAVAGAKARGSSIVDTGDIKLMKALQEGDPAKIDAAKALVEHEGVYASDDEIEKIAREQYGLVKLGEEAYHVLPPPQDPVEIPDVWPFNRFHKTLGK